MPSEVVIVPTYRRPELLFLCLKQIREIEPEIPILLFPDRGTWKDSQIVEIGKKYHTRIIFVPDHDFHGNSYNAMEAFRYIYNEGWETIYYLEEDTLVHPDFFKWHREQHEHFPKIFASMAWIFNRHAPIHDDILFQPWYYAIGTCFQRDKLMKIVEHATPRYYEDMQGYIEKNFKASKLNSTFGIQHYEQDGLIQRILEVDKTQTVSPGITKCTHLGFGGYNRGWDTYAQFFEGCLSWEDRLSRLANLLGDPYWRAEIFGREIVEREIGYELPKRLLKYRITLPGGWESEIVSELKKDSLPRRINSVTLPEHAIIEAI